MKNVHVIQYESRLYPAQTTKKLLIHASKKLKSIMIIRDFSVKNECRDSVHLYQDSAEASCEAARSVTYVRTYLCFPCRPWSCSG